MTWKRCKSAPETFRESPLRSLLWPSPFLHHCRHHHHHHHHHHFDLNSTNRKYTIAILILLLTFSTSKIIIPFAASHHESLKETWAKSLQAICWPRKYKRRVKITGGPIIFMIVWGVRPLYLVYPPCPNYSRTHFYINFAKLRSTYCEENQKLGLYVENSALDNSWLLFFSLP